MNPIVARQSDSDNSLRVSIVYLDGSKLARRWPMSDDRVRHNGNNREAQACMTLITIIKASETHEHRLARSLLPPLERDATGAAAGPD